MMHQPKPQASGSEQSSAHAIMHKCPACDAVYKDKGVSVIDKDGGASLIHATCNSCSQALLALVVDSQIGTSSVGMMTDLTLADAEKMQYKPELDEDDLFSFHTGLRHHEDKLIQSIIKDLV